MCILFLGQGIWISILFFALLFHLLCWYGIIHTELLKACLEVAISLEQVT